MAWRNRHRVGDYLMRDDESGIVYYASEMTERWDGMFVHKSQNEPRHPQEFVKAQLDPIALRHIRIDPPSAKYVNIRNQWAGTATDVIAPVGPAAHLFPTKWIGQGHDAKSIKLTENS